MDHPFISTSVVNSNGQKILDFYDRYHEATDPIVKEALLETAIKKIPRNKALAKKAFEDKDKQCLINFLSKTYTFRPTDESIFSDIEKVVEPYLKAGGADRFNLYIYRKSGHQKMQTLAVERRIGIKASSLQQVMGISAPEAQSFFFNDHAKAFVETILRPSIQKILSDPPKRKDIPPVEVIFTSAAPRKFRMNINVCFLIPFSEVIKSPESLHYVGEKLKLLDQFILDYPLFS